jgi:hypothetical protein
MRGLGLVAALAAAGAVLLGASPAGASGWTVVPSPPSDGGFFNAVSARTDADAWAVGDLSATTPLTARWDGTSWSQVPGPTVTGATNTVLNAVSAASASDAWAVGRATQSLVTSSLAAHWNGTAWTVVATPHVPGSVLTGVADISPTDAYAIGGGAEALHWDGTAWSAFAVPAPGGATPALLSAVAAGSPGNVWIAGQYFDTAKDASEPFIAHFNGKTWSPGKVRANGAEFFGLTVISRSDAWAVGNNLNGKAITANWTGHSWQVVPNPASGLLLGVTATGPGNVTAVGHNTTVNGPTAGIILSWNGSAWTKVKVPRVGATEELYSASAALGSTLTWAFGRSTSSGGVVSNLTLRNG